MQRIYFDNAATTAVDEDVLKAMLPYFTEKFGNASSIYSYGRETKMAIEKARKSVAKILNTTPGEVFFTSCGTESSNTAIQGAVRDLGCKHIITSPIEHHATLHTVEFLKSIGACKVSYVKLTENGHVNLQDLEDLLRETNESCLVTLMHANNEIGNLLDIEKVAFLCKKYSAIFHTDTVQTIGHFNFDGPKGSGMLYVNKEISIKPFINGGAQERMMRAGTENVANIVGFATALENATANYEKDSQYILSLKNHLKKALLSSINGLEINGDDGEQSLYTVLNVSFPKNEKTEVLSMNLDIANICVSGGSACSSGAEGGSHVIKAIYPMKNMVPIRFSFSKYNTKEEVDIVVEKIKNLLS